MRNVSVLSVLAASLSSAPCGGCDNDFDPASRVDELRLLAVQADRPFALPGDEVRLSAIAFDPAQRPLSWGWGPCIEPASTNTLDCLRALRFDALTIADDQPEYVLRIPETDASYVGVVTVVCPGTLVAGDTEGVPLACLGADGSALALSEFELGAKRIFLREPALNHNPIITEVRWDGALWPEGELKLERCEQARAEGSCERWTEHRLEIVAPDAIESSGDADGDGERITERAVLQLYATGGSFEDDVRVIEKPNTTWRARREDAARHITFWFVVRDDRGGVSWVTRELQVP